MSKGTIKNLLATVLLVLLMMSSMNVYAKHIIQFNGNKIVYANGHKRCKKCPWKYKNVKVKAYDRKDGTHVKSYVRKQWYIY